MIEGLKAIIVSIMCLMTGFAISHAVMWSFVESPLPFRDNNPAFFLVVYMITWGSVVLVTTMALINILVVPMSRDR